MTEILIAGRTAAGIMLLVICVVVYVLMRLSKRWTPEFRKIAGLEALPEAVGRATETAGVCHVTCGIDTLTGPNAPQIVAGLAVLGRVAQLCAKTGTKMIASIGQAEALPIVDDLIRAAYLAAGKVDQIRPDMVQFFSNEASGFAYAAGVTGLLGREKVAANIMVGPFYGEQLGFAEIAFGQGAIQIGGTARLVQIPPLAITCDYVLIGEEMFAASAFLSGDREQMNSIAGQDVGKLIALVLILAGVILTLAGNDTLNKLLKF